MKSHSPLLFLIVLLAIIPVYFINRALMRVIQPRGSAARLFLFFLANFLLVIVYTTLLVGLMVKLFPV